MKPSRSLEHPHLLALLALVFALVPAWLAVVTYRDARQKDQRVFETTAQVLGEQLQREFERHAYFPRELRNRARDLESSALQAGKMVPDFPWREKLPHLTALAYAEIVDGRIVVRWTSEERSRVVNLGDDLAAIPAVAATLNAASSSDPGATLGCSLGQQRMLLLLALPGNRSAVVTHGYIAAWVDLSAMCRDAFLPLVRDKVLVATPVEGDEPPATQGTWPVVVHDGLARWSVGIARGPGFSRQYGPPPPWFTFLAVGLSTLPVLILAGLAGRSTKLRAALAAERDIAQQQRFFTQSVSHEFRTPLGVILSAAELLDRYAEHLTPERRREVLAEIKDNTRQMTEMVEGVLLLGRIEASKLACTRQPVNVAEFCHGIVRKITASNANAAIAVEAPEATAMLDVTVLGSTLENLLSNAVKYSPPGQRVSLSAAMEKERIVFTVRDEGIGIPPAEISRVCDPFHRCKNVGDAPGSGLGLAIARRCAELHGGTLEIESAEGRGTTVTVRIPAL